MGSIRRSAADIPREPVTTRVVLAGALPCSALIGPWLADVLDDRPAALMTAHGAVCKASGQSRL